MTAVTAHMTCGCSTKLALSIDPRLLVHAPAVCNEHGNVIVVRLVTMVDLDEASNVRVAPDVDSVKRAEHLVEAASRLATTSDLGFDQAHRVLLDTVGLLEAERHLTAVRDLIEHARKVSPGERMVVYVADVEAALGMATGPRPHKLGRSEPIPAPDTSWVEMETP